MDSIQTALFIDITTLIVCALLLLNHGRMRHSHPATIYLFFHLYTFTLRLVALLAGAPTLFTTWLSYGFFSPVEYSEIARAALMADVAFIAMTVAWISVAQADLRKFGAKAGANRQQGAPLSLKYIRWVAWIVMPVGLIGFLALGNVPGLDQGGSISFGDWQGSTWVGMTQSWFGLGLLALVYWYGFRLSLMGPLLLYLLLQALQGYARYRVIIPTILLVMIFLDRHRRKWPPARLTVLLLLMVLLFFPLKAIGQMVQSGASVDEIFNRVAETTQSTLTGTQPDQEFLDQFASGVTLVDEGGRFYYGATWAGLLVSPIPRPLWPDKPGLADYLREISTPERPMFETGMIITFYGEAYANFGYVGLVLIPALLAYGLGLAYFRAYRSNYFSVERFSYLIVVSVLLQIYRDGLVSLIIFPLVNMMPLTVIVLLHLLKRIRLKQLAGPDARVIKPAGVVGS